MTALPRAATSRTSASAVSRMSSASAVVMRGVLMLPSKLPRTNAFNNRRRSGSLRSSWRSTWRRSQDRRRAISSVNCWSHSSHPSRSATRLAIALAPLPYSRSIVTSLIMPTPARAGRKLAGTDRRGPPLGNLVDAADRLVDVLQRIRATEADVSVPVAAERGAIQAGDARLVHQQVGHGLGTDSRIGDAGKGVERTRRGVRAESRNLIQRRGDCVAAAAKLLNHRVH